MNRKRPVRIEGEEAIDELEGRMEAVAWGLILVVTGTALMIPGWTIPVGGWLAGIGLVLLGLNLARYLWGIETRGLTTVLGVAALAAAGGMFLGLGLVVFPILLIVAGAWIVLRQFVRGNPGQNQVTEA
jgi:hypothetical protein